MRRAFGPAAARPIRATRIKAALGVAKPESQAKSLRKSALTHARTAPQRKVGGGHGR